MKIEGCRNMILVMIFTLHILSSTASIIHSSAENYDCLLNDENNLWHSESKLYVYVAVIIYKYWPGSVCMLLGVENSCFDILFADDALNVVVTYNKQVVTYNKQSNLSHRAVIHGVTKAVYAIWNITKSAHIERLLIYFPLRWTNRNWNQYCGNCT